MAVPLCLEAEVGLTDEGALGASQVRRTPQAAARRSSWRPRSEQDGLWSHDPEE